MARASAVANTLVEARRSTTTISLPRPFIFRKGMVLESGMRRYMANLMPMNMPMVAPR